MNQIEKTAFISYRRTNAPWALSIYQNLTRHGYDVFFDFNGIASGDFNQVIFENIMGRAHFLVLLTPSALEGCVNKNDWLRREIETALDAKRNIVPIMLEGFDFTSPSISRYLTGKISNLNRYNALRVPADYFDEAMRRLREKYLNIPIDTVLHPPLATAIESAKIEQAEANKAAIVSIQELTAIEWFEQGYNAIDIEEQINRYTQAIGLNPNFAEAYINRGFAREDNGDLEGAIQDYNEAIRCDPDIAAAYNNRGLVRYKNGDLEGAMQDYIDAIRLDPNYAGTYYNRGLTHEDNGDLEGAIQDYDKAIHLDPDFANAYNRRGIARKKKGDLEGAIQDYNDAIRCNPDYGVALNNRGLARQKTGELEGALQDLNKAVRLNPDNALRYYNRALIRRKIGDMDGAIKDYGEAIRCNPDYSEAYYNRALLYEDKDIQAAVADYQSFIDVASGLLLFLKSDVEDRIRQLKEM